MTLANETDIICRCQRGEQEAFAELYRHYERPMLSLAYRLLHSQEEAEDALQDAFLSMYRGIRRFRAEAAFSATGRTGSAASCGGSRPGDRSAPRRRWSEMWCS